MGKHQEAISDLKAHVDGLNRVMSNSPNSITVRLTLTESQIAEIKAQLEKESVTKAE